MASTASRRSRARSRWTSCSGSPSSSRYARTAAGGNPSSRSSAIDECPCRFESFLPSSPSTSPWWITSGSSPPSARAIARCTARFGRWSLPRIDMRDPELEVVDDRRELIRRASRRRGPASCRLAARRIEPSSSRSTAFPQRSARSVSRGVDAAPFALPHRALVERDPEPRQVVEDRVLPAFDGSARIRVVDAQDEHAAVLVGEASCWRRQ